MAHRRRPDHRSARRLRRGRPARADGAGAVVRTPHRYRPARTLARGRRPVHGLPRARAHRPDHLGLRARGARRRRRRDRHAADVLPGRADGDGRSRSARRWSVSSPRGRRGGDSPTRPGTSCTSTPTWPSRWRSPTSSRPGPTSPTGGCACCGRRCYVVVAGLLLWYRVCVPLRAAFRHRLRVTRVVRENRDVVSIYLTGRPPRRTRRGRRAVLPLALPHPRPVVGGQPVLAVGRAGARPTADHREDHRAAQRGAAAAQDPEPGCSPKGRTARSPPRVAGDGASCSSAPASASPRCARLFESLPGDPGELTLVYRASSADDLVLRHEIDTIAAARGANVHYVVGRRHRNRIDPLSAGGLGRS